MKQNSDIRLLLEGLKYFYPTYFGEEPHGAGKVFDYKGKQYSKNWIVSETFRIAGLPEKDSDISIAIRKLEGIYISAENEFPAANLPGKGTLEEFQGSEAERLAKVKEINARSKEVVQAAI